MGFTINYESTKHVPRATVDQMRQATNELCRGYTWLSCEPVGFFELANQGKLWGASKPNFFPHPDDVAPAANDGLPDGTVMTLLDILCQLSRDYHVDWRLSHELDARPMGFIRGGECAPGLVDAIDGFEQLVAGMQNLEQGHSRFEEGDDWDSAAASENRNESQHKSEDDDSNENPHILKFRPK
jgi:hypothetical protein